MTESEAVTHRFNFFGNDIYDAGKFYKEDLLDNSFALRDDWIKASRLVYEMVEGRKWEAGADSGVPDEKSLIEYGLNEIRWFSNNTAIAAARWLDLESGDTPVEQKEAFLYLLTGYEKMGYSWEGFFKGLDQGVAREATTYMGVGLAAKALKGGVALAKTAGVQGADIVTDQIKKRVTASIAKSMAAGAAAGAGYGAYFDEAAQKARIEGGQQEDYNLESRLTATFMGGALGGALGGGLPLAGRWIGNKFPGNSGNAVLDTATGEVKPAGGNGGTLTRNPDGTLTGPDGTVYGTYEQLDARGDSYEINTAHSAGAAEAGPPPGAGAAGTRAGVAGDIESIAVDSLKVKKHLEGLRAMIQESREHEVSWTITGKKVEEKITAFIEAKRPALKAIADKADSLLGDNHVNGGIGSAVRELDNAAAKAEKFYTEALQKLAAARSEESIKNALEEIEKGAKTRAAEFADDDIATLGGGKHKTAPDNDGAQKPDDGTEGSHGTEPSDNNKRPRGDGSVRPPNQDPYNPTHRPGLILEKEWLALKENVDHPTKTRVDKISDFLSNAFIKLRIPEFPIIKHIPFIKEIAKVRVINKKPLQWMWNKDLKPSHLLSKNEIPDGIRQQNYNDLLIELFWVDWRKENPGRPDLRAAGDSLARRLMAGFASRNGYDAIKALQMMIDQQGMRRGLQFGLQSPSEMIPPNTLRILNEEYLNMYGVSAKHRENDEEFKAFRSSIRALEDQLVGTGSPLKYGERWWKEKFTNISYIWRRFGDDWKQSTIIKPFEKGGAAHDNVNYTVKWFFGATKVKNTDKKTKEKTPYILNDRGKPVLEMDRYSLGRMFALRIPKVFTLGGPGIALGAIGFWGTLLSELGEIGYEAAFEKEVQFDLIPWVWDKQLGLLDLTVGTGIRQIPYMHWTGLDWIREHSTKWLANEGLEEVVMDLAFDKPNGFVGESPPPTAEEKDKWGVDQWLEDFEKAAKDKMGAIEQKYRPTSQAPQAELTL